MQVVDMASKTGFFEVVAGTERSQGASMVLSPGRSTGGPTNRHRSSDQWLYVVSGTGVAVVEGTEYEISEGDLVLIEAGETHEIKNPSDRPLETVNVYAPPDY